MPCMSKGIDSNLIGALKYVNSKKLLQIFFRIVLNPIVCFLINFQVFVKLTEKNIDFIVKN